MTTPWRDPRTGIYKLRKRVPARLLDVAGVPGGFVKLSTGTADRTELKRQWPSVLQRYAELEADWVRKLNAVALTPELASRIAMMWTTSGAPLDRGGAPPGLFSVGGVGETTAETAALQLARREFHADEALHLAGIEARPATRNLLLKAMRGPVMHAYLRDDLRHDPAALAVVDAVVPPPPSRSASPGPALSVPLRDLLTSYERYAAIKPRTLAEVRYAIEGLIGFLGHGDAARIQRVDLARWRDGMTVQGRSANTFNNRLSLVGQVLAWGVKEELLQSNVASLSLRLAKATTKARAPYTDTQAARILEAARLEVRPSLRWAHWIMAFSGARAGEVLQLTKDDISSDAGVWYFDVHEEGEGRTVKNGQRRHVPFHPALIAEGFLDYVQTVGAGEPLFPDKTPDRHGNRGGRSWNLLGAWVRTTVGIQDPDLAPSHSWRHRVEDELRAAGVEEYLRDALLGHARKTMGRVYGVRGESLVSLAERLARIPVPVGVIALR